MELNVKLRESYRISLNVTRCLNIHLIWNVGEMRI